MYLDFIYLVYRIGRYLLERPLTSHFFVVQKFWYGCICSCHNSGNNLRITPAVGRTREISFNDISRCIEKEQIGLKIFVGNKKICTVSCDCVGYKEFLEMLKERSLL